MYLRIIRASEMFHGEVLRVPVHERYSVSYESKEQYEDISDDSGGQDHATQKGYW